MKTKDIGVITTLKTLGHSWTSIDEKDSTEIWFEYGEETAKIASDYYSDNLQVNPRELIDNLKRIKSLLYFIKNKNENIRHNNS